jgi:hypothetical protein
MYVAALWKCTSSENARDTSSKPLISHVGWS